MKTYTLFHSFKLTLVLLTLSLTLGVGEVWGADITYSFTINSDDFNTTSYAANNNEKTSTATCTTDSKKTMSVKWTSNQVMKNSSNMQWQKNNGYIYNSTDLGTINSVTVTSSAGSFTNYYGTSEHPTSGTTVGNGFFTVKVGNDTGTTSRIVINFTISEGGGTPTCATPTFSPAAGSYIGTQSVTISSTTTGSTIYYTTDGSTPTTGSAHGTAGEASATVSVSSNMTLKAIAVKDGANNSTVGTAEYSIVSCGGDDFNWNLSTNTYTTGTDEVTWSHTYATMHNAGTNATNYLGGDANNRTSSRFYNDNTLTITPASGVTISHVVFTATTDGYAGVLRNSTWSNATASGSGTYVIVTPTDGTSAFSATVGGTCGFTNVNVCYSACSTLGSINGSINMSSSTDGTVTVSGWTYNAGSTGTTESNVSSYTVKLYKYNSGTSSWAIANESSTSGGASGTAATRTGIARDNKSVTYSGLEYGATYKFTVTAIGTGAYCDGPETAVTSINGNALTDNKFLNKYSIYIDEHDNSRYSHHYIESLSSHSGSVDINLEAFKNGTAAGTYYQYKLVLGGVLWFGNNGTMNSTYHDNWTFSSGESSNCKLQTAMGGAYTFAINTTDGGSYPQVSVTYPSANQSAGYNIYWDNSVLNWGTLRYRIGNNSNNQNQTPTLVPGTDNFYVVTTPLYNDMEAWHFANNPGWADNHTIYRTATDGSQTGIAITASTVFQQYKVTENITVIPTTTHSTGTDNDGDKVNNQCEFYTINTPTSGMLTHNVAVGSAEHGTVVATYTNTSGTEGQTVAEGANADLAHRCIVTITATPDAGYSCTALTVNGDAFTSGNTHILTANATIAATFTAQTSTVTLDNNDATSGSSQTVTATYDAAMPLTTTSSTSVAALSRTGYTFTGWWDAASDGTQYYSYNAGTSTLSSARTWNKTGAQTLKAQWSINSYTLTWATVRGKITTAGTGAAVDATGNVSSSVEYNTALTVPECGNSNGYTFSGWSPTPASNMPAENTTYTAQWTANEYTVTLNNQGATTAGAASVSATFAQAMPSIAGNLPERTGYSFGGYFTNTNGGGTKYYKADGTSATNMALYGATPTLYAYWIAQISFSVNGNIISTQAVTAALPSSATVPTSCGDCWAFAGWSTNSECSTAPEHAGGENATTHGITTPTTLYAVYRKGSTSLYSTEPSCPTYTITWVVNGETYSTGTPTTSTNECTGITTLPTAPSNSTLTCADKFMGWSESTLTGTGNDAPDDLFTNAAGAPTIDENKTFYAVFATAEIGESTTTLTQTYNTVTLGTNYSNDGSDDFTLDDSQGNEISMERDNMIEGSYSTSHYIQIRNQSGAGFWNATPIPGAITNITVQAFSANSFKLYVGTSKKATTNEKTINSTTTQSFDFDAVDGLNYFYFASNSAAGQITSYIVTYKPIEYKDYVTTCCTAYTITGATTSGTVVTGGTLTSTNNSSCEGNDVKITATVSTGYRFDGWNITSGGSPVARKAGSAETEGGNPIYIFTMPSAAVTVSADIAKWTTTVTLDANGGTGADQTVIATYGAEMPSTTTSDLAIVVPTKTGAKLLGYWDTDASSGGTQYYSYDGSTLSSTTNWDKEDESVTLYARWLTVDYYIDDMHGTTGYAGEGMEKSGAGYTVPGPIADSKAGNVCEKEHYIFVGWVSADGQNTDGTLKGTPTIVQPGEVKDASGKTYYAVWAEE